MAAGIIGLFAKIPPCYTSSRWTDFQAALGLGGRIARAKARLFDCASRGMYSRAGRCKRLDVYIWFITFYFSWYSYFAFFAAFYSLVPIFHCRLYGSGYCRKSSWRSLKTLRFLKIWRPTKLENLQIKLHVNTGSKMSQICAFWETNNYMLSFFFSVLPLL